MSRKHKSDGLESKVKNLNPFKDAGGDYISYCNFHCHRGIIERPKVCESRNCNYYHKFYINTEPKAL